MRKFLAVILGAILATAVLLMVGFIANTIRPTPPELMDPATPEAVEQRLAAASAFTWTTTLFGLALGALIGGVIGAKIAKKKLSG